MFFKKKRALISSFTFFPKIMVISRKKRSSLQFDLWIPYFAPKSRCSLKKKRSSPRIDLVFLTFRPDFIITSKKHLQRIETLCAIFEGGQKPRVTRQLLHSPHPISTTDESSLKIWLIILYY